jgi:tetratricopeptide (TPR) repeat protein
MKKHLILAAVASLAVAGMLRAEEAAAEAKAEATAAATPVAKNDAPGSLGPGKVLLDEGKFAEAAAYFEGIGEQVVANGTKKREPWRLNNWALALLEAGQYEKAAEIAQKLIDSNPEMEGAWNKLAAAQARNGMREEAIQTYDKAIAKLTELGGDISKLESNKAALLQVIEEGKPKKVREAEAKARAEAEAAKAKAAEAGEAAK